MSGELPSPPPPPIPPSLLSRALPSKAARTDQLLWAVQRRVSARRGRAGLIVTPGWVGARLDVPSLRRSSTWWGAVGAWIHFRSSRLSIITLQSRTPGLGVSEGGGHSLPLLLLQPHLWSWEDRPPAAFHSPCPPAPVVTDAPVRTSISSRGYTGPPPPPTPPHTHSSFLLMFTADNRKLLIWRKVSSAPVQVTPWSGHLLLPHNHQSRFFFIEGKPPHPKKNKRSGPKTFTSSPRSLPVPFCRAAQLF